jgi:hypothetical protein
MLSRALILAAALLVPAAAPAADETAVHALSRVQLLDGDDLGTCYGAPECIGPVIEYEITFVQCSAQQAARSWKDDNGACASWWTPGREP